MTEPRALHPSIAEIRHAFERVLADEFVRGAVAAWARGFTNEKDRELGAGDAIEEALDCLRLLDEDIAPNQYAISAEDLQDEYCNFIRRTLA